jgi:serine/threonine-protein kinase
MRRGLSIAVLVAVLAAPAVARAQKDDVSRAESLFNAGKALLESGQNVDACAKFAESKRLAPGLGVTLYLADCYERIGRIASAWSEFCSAEGLARQRNDKRADVARGRAQDLEAKLDRLTIAVAPTVPTAGLSILRDGAAVSQEEWGLAVPVDPGDHTVVVSSPGHAPRTIAAHVGPDAPNATVRIDRLEDTAPSAPTASPARPPAPSSAAEAPPPLASSPAPASPPAPADPGTTRRWVGIGVGAAGLVGIAVGSAFGLSAKSKLDDSNSGPCDAQDKCDRSGLALRQDASNAATASTIAFAIGGVAVAAGVVLYVTAPHASQTVGVAVSPTPGGGSALVTASF